MRPGHRARIVSGRIGPGGADVSGIYGVGVGGVNPDAGNGAGFVEGCAGRAGSRSPDAMHDAALRRGASQIRRRLNKGDRDPGSAQQQAMLRIRAKLCFARPQRARDTRRAAGERKNSSW
jgi:hypothetical protein